MISQIKTKIAEVEKEIKTLRVIMHKKFPKENITYTVDLFNELQRYKIEIAEKKTKLETLNWLKDIAEKDKEDKIEKILDFIRKDNIINNRCFCVPMENLKYKVTSLFSEVRK